MVPNHPLLLYEVLRGVAGSGFQRTSPYPTCRVRLSCGELLRCWRAARRCSSSRRRCQPTCRGAVGSLPPAEAKDRCTRACRCW
eukprot:scaffold3042_cov29-Phaeocystis_antarctica.AAC.1